MGVKLVATTGADEKLRVITTVDDAIDWDATYPAMGPASDRKLARYIVNHDVSELSLKPDAKPTLFVFQHPKRADVAKKIRGLYTRQMTDKEKSDLFTDIFEQAFVGTQEGSDDADVELAPRVDGKLTYQYIQALQDAGVLEELALAFVTVANKRPSGEVIKKK